MRVKIGEEEYEVVDIDNVDDYVTLQCVSRKVTHLRTIPLTAMPAELETVAALTAVSFVDESIENPPEGVNKRGHRVEHIKDATGKWIPTQ